MKLIIIVLVIGALVFILSRPEIRLLFYSYIDPVSGKDIRKLGYKLVYVKENIHMLKRGQVAVIRKNPDIINSGDLVYMNKTFWEVLAINRETNMIKLKGKREEVMVNQIKGVVVGKERI